MDKWIKDIDSGKFVGALLIDLSKAFDSVSHQILIKDLIDIGCSLNTVKWFTDYLTNRVQRVIGLLHETSWKSVTKGVPQGSCFSPHFFNIFLRNLPTDTQTNSIQFSDDITEYMSDEDPSVITKSLLEGFERTKAYFLGRQLSTNVAKTQCIFFKIPSKKLPEDLELTIDGCIIKPSKSVKLLGVTLDHHLFFSDRFSNVTKKCHGFIGILTRAAPSLPKDFLRLAYSSLIRSRLE